MPVSPDPNAWSYCRHCGCDYPRTETYWYRHRASGGLHVEARCRRCERTYRQGRAASRQATPVVDTVVPVTAGLDRRFGVEIEFNDASRADVARRLTRLGVLAERMSYTHEVYDDRWKVVTDDTVEGGELVSPPLHGSDGRNQVVLACRALAAAGATVDSACGLHVHHDVQDLSGRHIAKTVRNYYESQMAIDGLVSQSRRSDQYCSYSRAIEINMVEGLEACSDSISRLRNHAYNYDRYYNVNVSCYPTYGTIEFRQHQGTINSEKILAWVALGQSLIAASIAGVIVDHDRPEDLIAVLTEHGLPDPHAEFLRKRAEHFATAMAGR